MKKLAIIITHPIQYYAPVFRMLHERGIIAIKVFYTWGEASIDKFDPGFKINVEWDVPLLEGYPFEWVLNTSAKPGSHNYSGIVNPYLIRQVKAYQPNAVLFFGWAYKSHLKAIRYFSGKLPVYFRGDSTLLDKQEGFKSVLRKYFLKWVYRHVNHAFYVGAANKAYFRHFGLAEKQLTFAGHAIDNERFSIQRADEAQELRDNLHLKRTDVLIVFAGKFEDKKDPLALIRAFNAVKMPYCHLLFVGNGKLEARMKQEASGFRNIHFMDFRNQAYMPVIYQACQLFCLPSKGPGETWGLAVNEAMASGRAVVVSDKTGCAADLVKDNYNGTVFNSGSESDLAAKLNKLLKSPVMLTTYGANSSKLIMDYNFINIAIAVEKKLQQQKTPG